MIAATSNLTFFVLFPSLLYPPFETFQFHTFPSVSPYLTLKEYDKVKLSAIFLALIFFTSLLILQFFSVQFDLPKTLIYDGKVLHFIFRFTSNFSLWHLSRGKGYVESNFI